MKQLDLRSGYCDPMWPVRALQMKATDRTPPPRILNSYTYTTYVFLAVVS